MLRAFRILFSVGVTLALVLVLGIVLLFSRLREEEAEKPLSGQGIG